MNPVFEDDPGYREDPAVIKKILEHLEQRTESVKRTPHPARAPPAPT